MDHKVKHHALNPVPVGTLFAFAENEGHIPMHACLCLAISVLDALAGCNCNLHEGHNCMLSLPTCFGHVSSQVQQGGQSEWMRIATVVYLLLLCWQAVFVVDSWQRLRLRLLSWQCKRRSQGFCMHCIPPCQAFQPKTWVMKSISAATRAAHSLSTIPSKCVGDASVSAATGAGHDRVTLSDVQTLMNTF